MTLGIDVMVLNGIRQQIRAEHFPTTAGIITHSEVQVISSGKGASYDARLRYAYRVAGRDFVGNRYRYGSFTASAERARTLSARYPVGAPVSVRYNPADPADAILTPGIEGADLFAPLFLLPFNLLPFAIGPALYGPRLSIRARWARPSLRCS